MTTISFAARAPFARSKGISASSSSARLRRTRVVVKSAARSKRRSDANDDFPPSMTTSPPREEDDNDKNKEEMETYHLQGVSSGGKSLIVFLSWCAFAEKTGILEPIFVNSSPKEEEKKTSKKAQKPTRSARWKDRAKREFSKNTPFGESENFPLKLSFQRGKTYFTEKRFKKSISDGTETKFDAKGEKLKAELQKRKNVEILKRELLQKKMEEAKEIERERAKTQKEAEMKAQKVKEELEMKAKMKIDAERKKQEQKEKAKQQMMMQEQQQQQQQQQKNRQSVTKIGEELNLVYELVERNGRGAIYLGSSRIDKEHAHFARSKSLAKAVAVLLECTTWSGIGPGLMDAVTLGGLEANGKASGILILMGEKEERDNIEGKVMRRQKTRKHPYLNESQYATCSFFSARKHGLVDAGVRNGKEDTKTAFFCLPGGIGTMDEFAEILTLFQLRRIGSEEKVPFLLMNYDGVFDKLLEFITVSCVEHGLVNEGEMEEHLKVCSTNEEALEYLKHFYAL